jgi:ABC-2 type transport system ATP-binding protein
VFFVCLQPFLSQYVYGEDKKFPQVQEKDGKRMYAADGMVIQTRGLSKTFKAVTALNGLNLEVPRNSIFGFLGPNGSGKSTTIKLLLGLIQPTQGSATVFGQDIRRESIAIRRRIGYLAQDPRYYEYMTARETVRYVARFFYSSQEHLIEDRVQEVLSLVGLEDKADRPIKGFSGGERQRLGIAHAQVNYPDLLILDEPAASLDPMGRRDVLEVMERLRKYTTIFYSTHILEDVQRVSDTVAILNHGQLIAQAPIQELLAGGGSSAVYSLTLKGDVSAAQARIIALPWVQSLNIGQNDGLARWQVSVSDTAAAEQQLLRCVLEDAGLVVTSFGKKTYNLEEVFLNLVEGSEKNGR